MAWIGTSWNVTTSAGSTKVGPHGSSKHARQLFDTTRRYTVLTGGDRDGSDAGQPNIYVFNEPVGSTTGQTPYSFFPTTGGPMCPPYPDNCTWVYSSVLDVYVIAKAFWFTTLATQLQPTRSTSDWLAASGIFNPHTSTRYGIAPKCYSTYEIPTPSLIGWGGDSNSNFACFDPVQNAIIRLVWDGSWGCSMQVIPLGDLVTFPQSVSFSVGSGQPSGSLIRNWLRNADCHARQQVIDVVNRKIYCVAQSAGGLDSTSDHGWGLLRVDLNNPTLGERLRLPALLPSDRYDSPATPGEVVFRPQTVAPGDGRDYIIAFDPIRNQVIFPQIVGYGGEVYNTLIYDIATSGWSVVDSNSVGPTSTGPWPVGNVFSFDIQSGRGVLTGGHGNSAPMMNHPTITTVTSVPSYAFYVAPGNSTAVQSSGTTTLAGAHVTAITAPLNVVNSSIVGGVYRFNVYDGVTSSFIATVDSASANVKSADFSNLILGKNYKFTGEHRTGLDTGTIGSVATRFATLAGVPTTTSSASGGDVNPPVITQLYPKSSDTVSGIISFQYTVTDTEGVSRVELYVNDVFLNVPTWDSRSVPNGTNNGWSVKAWDLSSNYATVKTGFTVDNPTPPPPPPTSTDDGVAAIFLNPSIPGRVGYVLWSTVPSGEEILRPGFRSAWPGATPAEIAELEAGRTRERSGTMKIEGTDEEMKARLIARWTEFNAEILALPQWTLEDTFWNGTGWVKR